MDRPSRRTSITIDEAIANLMGYATGPIDLQPDPDSDCEEAWNNIPDYDLDILVDEGDVLEGEYDLAKHERRPPHEVAEKQAAIKRQQEIIDQSYGHRCAINDELNKGECSMLRVDVAMSNAAYTYITWHSFKEWVKCRQSPAGGLPGAAEAANPAEVSVSSTKGKKGRDKGIRQQDAILAALREKYPNLLALPPNRSGHAGVRSEIYEVLKDSPLFQSFKVYETAWQRCLDLKLIAYEAAPTPLQKED